MHAVARLVGRTPRQRTALYGGVAGERVATSFRAASLVPLTTPARHHLQLSA